MAADRTQWDLCSISPPIGYHLLVALVTTILAVVGVLAGMALFLWFSAFIEARQLGPVMKAIEDVQPAAEPAPPLAA